MWDEGRGQDRDDVISLLQNIGHQVGGGGRGQVETGAEGKDDGGCDVDGDVGRWCSLGGVGGPPSPSSRSVARPPSG